MLDKELEPFIILSSLNGIPICPSCLDIVEAFKSLPNIWLAAFCGKNVASNISLDAPMTLSLKPFIFASNKALPTFIIASFLITALETLLT